ncbi:hypothetical protein ACFPN2_21420 [Steroidobacter flavus]|uniref:Uncharacterized protein n=1 Tax=Steroidobacter flavus TaxID=1842136 RepID=A0ABV8SW02_9GAMM
MVSHSECDEEIESVATPGAQLANIATSLVRTRERVQATVHASLQEEWLASHSRESPVEVAGEGAADSGVDLILRKEGGGVVRIQAKSRAEAAASSAPVFTVSGQPGTGNSHVARRESLDHRVELLVVGVEVDAMYATVRTEPVRDRDRYDVDVNISLSDLDGFEVTALKRLLTEKLRSLVTAAREENADRRITQLVQAIAPEDPLADVELQVAESTVELRREFIDRVPVLTSADVHKNAGFPGSNPSQTVLRWRRSGKIFGINYGGRDLYPAFQFGVDGRPLPIVAELLAILKDNPDRTDWDNALWFAGDTGWLNGASPIERLQTDPESVRRAAEQEALRDEY